MKRIVKDRHLNAIILLIAFTIIIIGLSGLIMEEANNPIEKNGLDILSKNEEIRGKDFIYDVYTTFLPDPTPFTLIQPNGIEFNARMVGERVGGHVETLDGYSIIKDEMGWWTFATKDKNGVLIATKNRVGEIEPVTILGLQKHLFNDPPEIRELDYDDSPRSTRAPPHNTTWKAIAIMLYFQDESFDPSHNQAHYKDLLNGTTGNTVRTYYREVSYGQFDIEVDVVGPFQSSHVMAYYGDNEGGGRDNANGSISEMAKEAVQLADPTVDFSSYDLDSDGWIDALFIIHASSGEEQSGYEFDIWSHKSSTFYITNDGVRAGPYSTEPEDGRVGVFSHEFGHVLGLPDLYDTDGPGSGGDSSGIGQWGIMAAGSWNGFPSGSSPAHFCAWSKIELGWVEPTIVTSDVSLTRIKILPVENYPVIYKIWAHNPSQDTDEYFLVENKQLTGYDSALPGDGILIWHIDESVTTVNNNPNHLLVDLEEYDNYDGSQELQSGGPGEASDAWVNIVMGFRDTTDPNSDSYNGSSTDAWVWNISDISGDGNMSIGFNEIYSGPTEIFISDPVSNTTIKDVYDFILNDTYFPDEDVGSDNDGNNGSYVLEYRQTNTSDPFIAVSPQVPKEWIGGVKGVINCTALLEGYWDFRVKILDEEGHLLYTPIVWNIAVPTNIAPIADAGPDNSTDVGAPTMLDGSGSTDNSGYIAWFNWTFGDGTYYNGTTSKVVHNWSVPGVYQVILNVSDSFGNWDTDIVNITVEDTGPPVTTLTIGLPKYRENIGDYWNVTSNVSITSFTLTAVDNWAGVNFSWYTVDGVYFKGASFNLLGYDEGLHNITYGSEDNVGNNETGNFILVVLDNSAPEAPIGIGSPKYRNNTGDDWNVTETTLFTLLPYDKYSGIDFVWFIIGSNPPQFGTNFTLLGNADGLISITWKAQDYMSNNIIQQISVNLDSTSPITDISIGTPRFRAQPTDNWNITTSTQLTITNNNDGDGSGINFIWYSIDSIYYEYSAPFTLTPGAHTITWGGEDNIGNNETGNSQIINVDDQPPITNLVIGSPKFHAFAFDNWNVSSETEFTLQSQDQYSGVNHSWYIIDGQYFEGSTFNLTSYPEGLYTLTWGSMDNVGNNETGISLQVYLDNTPPTTSMVVSDPKYRDSPSDYWNVTTNTDFSLFASDSQSGVNVTWYILNTDYYEDTNFNLSGYSDGLYVITWGSKDNVGNNETGNTIFIWLDDSAPETTLIILLPRYPIWPFDGCNVTSSTNFPLSGVDKPDAHNVGINFTWYMIDGDFYFGLFFDLSLYGEGPHIITWGSEDFLGNNETGNFIITWLDDSAPKTSLTVDSPRHPSSPYDGCNVSSATPFSLFGTDEPIIHSTGISLTWYAIDGDYYLGTSFNLTSYGEGSHVITWGSIDNLGQNETGNSITVWLDNSPPETNLTIGFPRYPLSPYEGCNVTLAAQFSLSRMDKPAAHNAGVTYTWFMIESDFYIGTIFDLSGYGEGSHTITWGSIDNVDNNETGNSITVWLDDSTPETTLSIGSPRHPSSPYDGCNVTPITQFSLSRVDKPNTHNAGVNFTWYTIDGDIYLGLSFDLSIYGEGSHTITWGSEDTLGHNETGNIIIIWVDDSSPVTSLTIGSPRYPTSPYDGCNLTSSTPFSISGTDRPFAHSAGISFTWFTIDGDYFVGNSFNLLGYGEGSHTITWGSIDYLGNNETGKSITVWLDDSAPETTITIGLPRHPLSPYDGSNITSTSQITFSRVDKPAAHNADIDFTWYTIDGDYYVGTSFDLSGYGESSHTITWGSEDHLGNNETGNSIIIWVDDSAPVTTLTVGSPRHPLLPFDGSNVTSMTQITLSRVENPGSHNAGISLTWYTIDGDYYVGSSFDLSGYGEGLHAITWGSTDYLDNNETGNNIVLILDNSPPSTDIFFSPRNRNNETDYWNITNTTTFTLLPTDLFSGVNFTWYSIDGVYFEGLVFTLLSYNEGLHTITWGSLDYLGWNETNSMIVNLNYTSPLTTITINGPKYRNSPIDYWNVTSTSVFTLATIYTPTVVDFTWYTIDGAYFEGMTFTLSGYAEGPHYFTWGSQDELGYNETGNFWVVFIDNKEPITSVDIGGPKYPLIPLLNITSFSPINLSSNDGSGSGVASIYYRIYNDSGPVLGWTEYQLGTLFFNLSGYGEGNYTIVFYAKDNLGNVEVNNFYDLYLDNSGPITNLDIGEPKYRAINSDYWNVTSGTEFSLFSWDSRTEVDIIWYTIDNKYFEGDNFDLTGYTDGGHTITWGGVDKLGNNRTGGTAIVILDTNPPVTDLDIGMLKYRENDDDDWYVIDTTLFTLTSIDQYSGVRSIWYTIDNEYFRGSSFNFDGYEDGLHTITWGSIDNLGNNETGNSKRVNFDSSPPLTNLVMGIPKYRNNDIDYWNITDSTPLTLKPTDQGSGVNITWYTIEGSYFEGFTFNFQGYDDGFYTVTWGSKDNLGINESANVLVIYLDNTPPSILIEFGTPHRVIKNVTHITSSTPITLIPFDSGVGGTTLYYSTDGGDTYALYISPFTVPSMTTAIIYGGEDALGNRGPESIIDVVLDDRDSDGDGIYNIGDDDDDNDGLLDTEEDLNQNGIVDEGETDHLNPDTDGDGHNDLDDKYPLDDSKWKEPSDWEKLPIIGGIERSLFINLVIILIIVVILLIIIMKQYRKWKARKSWADVPDKESGNGSGSEPESK